jgi:hypothetical protein
MKRPAHSLPHEDGDRLWHFWRCAECREARRMNREIRRRLKAAVDLPPSPDLEVRILAAMGIPPAAETGSRDRNRDRLPAFRRAVQGVVRRRALIVGAVAVGLAFLQLFPEKSSAETLQRVLAAMARVRTAHCSGWFVSYEGPAAEADTASQPRMPVEWWYQAPNRFRREMGPDVPQWSYPPGTLIINGDDTIFYSPRYGSDPPVRRKRQTRDLTPVDFFAPEGPLQRAAHDKHARIRDESESWAGGTLRILTVEHDHGGERLPMRFRWVLKVDPAADRIVHADWLMEYREVFRWRLGASETLDRFEYDVPVQDESFHFNTAERRRGSGK